MRRLAVVVVCALLSLPVPLSAAQKAGAGTENQATMDDMVVTATRTEEPLKEIPGRVEVITQEQLKEMPVQTVDEALSYISGAHLERTSGLDSFKSVLSLRGLGNTQGRTLVMLDGVPLNTADMGDVNWNRLNLEDVKRIEILKGPAASVYGSNAMGGVINIITQKPTKMFEGRTSASYGTNADWNLRAVAAGRSSEDPQGFYIRASALSHTNQGFKNVPSEQTKWYTKNLFLDEKTFNGKVGWDLTESNNLEFQYTKDMQTAGEGKEMFAYNGVHRGYDTDAFQGKFTGSWEGWSGMINAYYMDEHYERCQESITDSLFGQSSYLSSYSRIDSKVDRKNYGVLTNVSKEWGPNTFTAGFDYKVGTMDGTDYYRVTPFPFATNYGKIRSYGIFAQDQVRLLDDKLIFLGGLRYDNATSFDGHYDTNLTGFSQYTAYYPDHTWDQWSPRASVKYFFRDNLSAYASYAHAFRAPVLDDMYRTGKMMGKTKISNPNLGPENIDTFEVGADYQPVDNLKLSASGYHSIGHDLQSYVSLSSTTQQVQNLGEVKIWGLELNAEYEPFKHLDYDVWKKFTVFGNYTFNESRISQFSSDPTLVGKLLTYTPQNSFNLGFNWLNRYVNNQVAVQYVGKMFSDSTNTQAGAIDPHAIVNGKLWRNLDFLGNYGEKVTLSFTVENLLDSRYYISRNTDAWNQGRMMFLELTCKF
jgi:iron complex outermembrane receptor protein